MFRGRKGWLAVQGWGSKKQKDLFCLKNNMQPLKDHDNDYFIYICESDSQLFNQNFLCFFVLLWKMIMKIYYIDSSLHEEMLSIKGVLRHLETEHNVKLERLLVTHLPMVTGDYHTSAYFYRVSTKQAIYRTTDSSHGTDYGVC